MHICSRYLIILGILLSGYTGICQKKNSVEDNSFLVADSILDLPLTNERLVIAHYMTNILPAKVDGRINQAYDLEWYNTKGKSEEFGGLYQTAPYDAILNKDYTLEEAVEHEMRTALLLGVNGFHFFYPCFKADFQMERYNKVIDAFHRVAEEKQIDFKLTLCLCNPSSLSEQEATNRWAKGIADLYKGREDSDIWLKTPDGRFIFYTWVADGIIDELQGKHWEVRKDLSLIKKVAISYNKLAKKSGLPIAYNYHLRWPENQEFVDEVLKYFPAVCGWTNTLDDKDDWKTIATKCKQRNRDYTQTIYPDFYTSKVYKKDGKKPILNNNKVLEEDIEDLERHVHKMDLSGVFRGLNQWAIDNEASLINFTTWNDFPEGHHIAPELNHNFGFSLLLKYYKKLWKENSTLIDKETAIVFFKKYPESSIPKYDIACKVTEGNSKLNEDGIEVVTLLNKKAELWVNGNNCGKLNSGLQVTKLPTSFGPVKVQVKRKSKLIIDFTTPAGITKNPHRTDRLTYSYSNRFEELFQQIYGTELELQVSSTSD